MNLANKNCVPCEGGTPPFTPAQITDYQPGIQSEWQVSDQKKILRQFKFKNFKEAMMFVNSVADIAETEGHHPDIKINWNKVTLELTTHAISGLSENDFILAAKIDTLFTWNQIKKS
jgi:4a-hydroxytetrahydrobiopterin dehydratase